MSTQPNDGGPAFPYREQDNNGQYRDHFGLTMRDWFAGQALAAMRCGDWFKCEDGASWCYDYADAMLAEREKKQ